MLLARCLGQVPDLIEVRRALAENLYEEQTGGLSKSAPHPELFLRMMEGLGFSRSQFNETLVDGSRGSAEGGTRADADLHPAAQSYKDWLFATSARGPWQAAAALLTIFVEGSVNERAELAGTFKRARGNDAVAKHALVVHYGCPPEAMQLVRAHGDVEGGHRGDAWKILLDNTSDPEIANIVVTTCMDALVRWHRYRDGVAERMGLERDGATTAPPPVVMQRTGTG